MGRDGEGYAGDLGKKGTGIFLRRGGGHATHRIESFKEKARRDQQH
jgi:hypothetical protein